MVRTVNGIATPGVPNISLTYVSAALKVENNDFYKNIL